MMRMNSIARTFCPMKKHFFYLGASLVAIAALSSCNKELSNPDEGLKGDIPFEITAESVDTKTSIDGLTTNWVADDAINLFHAEAGTTTYTSDGQFIITAENLASKKFTGTLASELTADSYDWYAIYPYKSNISTPANTGTDGWVTIGGTTQTQDGNDSKAHLCNTVCPLYGVASGLASDVVPSIEMKHLTSIIEVNVANNSGKDLTVAKVSFTGSEDIVGTYFINFAGTPIVYTNSGVNFVSNTVSLSVLNGAAIADGASAKFYIAVKPFSANAEQTLKVSVNGYEKEIPHSSNVTFNAGKIKTVKFNYDKVVADYVTIPWEEDFSGNLDIYTLVNGGTDTRTYEQNLAGGTSPELLVSKENGSFSAKVKATAGKYVLTFKSNNPSYLSISVDKEEVTLSKDSETAYSLTVPESVDFFNITFTNTSTGNSRLDDISLKVDTRTSLSVPANVSASVDAETPNKVNVSWETVENASEYEVVLSSDGKEDIVKTATASPLSVSNLEYSTTYSVKIRSKNSDKENYKSSEYSAAVSVTTGVSTSKTVSYTVESTSTVTVSGTAPVSSSVAYSSTYKSKAQLTGGNSMTLTLSGYKGMIVKRLTLSMRSNKSSGAGYLSIKAGNTLLGSIGSSSSGVSFNNARWHGSWSTSYVDVTPTLSNDAYTVQNGEDIVIVIGATANSLYCESFTIEYVADPTFVGGSDPEKLSAPTVSCSAQTENSLTFTWAAVANASGYQVSTDGGVSYEATQTATEYTWTGLSASTTKTLYVKSIGDGTSYTDSDAVSASGTTTTSSGGEGGEGGTTKYFVKITFAPTDWSGEYLIVYEGGAVAFDGSRTTLDAVSNTVAVTITDSKIEATNDLLNRTFTINADGTTIQSKSGFYIGQTANDNGLKSSTSTSYDHTLSFTENGEFTAVSGGAYLRYNATSGQTRFRYFKSSSYTGQQAIQLYKLEN